MKTLQQIEPRTDINLLPGDATAVCVITGPGSYYLTADISGAAGKDTIRVASAGRVTIDLNGFALTNTGTDRSAIALFSANDAVVIRDGIILCSGGTSTRAVGGSGTRVICENLAIVGSTGATVLSLGDDSSVTRCRITQGGITAGLRSVVHDTRVHGTTEMILSLGDDSEAVRVQYAAGRGQLSVGNRGLIADCQVNVLTGPPAFLINGTVVQAGLGAVVRNCTITGGNASGNALGVGSNSLVSGCRISSVFRDGIVAGTAENVTVESCVVQGNGRDAITLGSNARVRDCTVASSGSEGIQVGENSVITGCSVSAGGGTGGIVSIAENVEVSHCAVKGVTAGSGISILSGSVTDCTVTGTTNGPGIQVTQRSIVSRNRSESNGVVTTNPQAGIRVIGPNNRIENNQLVNNAGFGLEITGAAGDGQSRDRQSRTWEQRRSIPVQHCRRECGGRDRSPGQHGDGYASLGELRPVASSAVIRIALLLLAVSLSGFAQAASTINSTEAYSYGANIGWMNWRPSIAEGVEIDEYVLSGFIYGANVGWIDTGDGTPGNNRQYSNTSAADFGVNYQIDPGLPGKAILRGFAYGANIGWINFENAGNPRLRFSDGRLEGYAYSANCGWINLGDGTFAVRTDSIAPGPDSDADGMADAFEFQFLGGIEGDPDADGDGDGTTNLEEYLAGTNPMLAGDELRLISIDIIAMGSTTTSTELIWASTLSRLYAIDSTTDLTDPDSWIDLGLDTGPNSIIPSIGSDTTRTVMTSNATRRFFRVRAIRPLVP